MNTLKVGTRGSKLARIQTESIVSQLKNHFPDLAVETVIVSSLGDRVQDRPLSEIGGSGLFTRELEKALLCGEIDLAVHSMKDLPAVLPEGLCLAPCPPRADPRDVLVLANGYGTLSSLPSGAVIGTGSPRRALQLTALRPDLCIVPIRGNVDTRLGKVGTQTDGVVLAAAGLIRAGYEDRITAYLSPEEMLPAPAQGILALELRSDDAELLTLLTALSHSESQLAATAERAFLRASGAGCHAPVAAHCRVEPDRLILTALYGREDSANWVRGTLTGPRGEAESLGLTLAAKLEREYKELYES